MESPIRGHTASISAKRFKEGGDWSAQNDSKIEDYYRSKWEENQNFVNSIFNDQKISKKLSQEIKCMNYVRQHAKKFQSDFSIHLNNVGAVKVREFKDKNLDLNGEEITQRLLEEGKITRSKADLLQKRIEENRTKPTLSEALSAQNKVLRLRKEINTN